MWGWIFISIVNAANANSLQKQATVFAQLVGGNLNSPKVQKLIEECKNPKSKNPFCYSVVRIDRIRRLQKKQSQIKVVAPKRPTLPLLPKIVKKKVSNWEVLRRGNMRSLIKGVESLSEASLEVVQRRAQTENRCPNQIAVAVAARLEDFFPNPDLQNVAAQLYVKGANCAKGRKKDREHYLTRAALLLYLQKDLRSARPLLKRVHPVDIYAGRSLYWLYRIENELGNQAAAEKIKKKLLVHFPFSFHASILSLEKNIPLLPTRKRLPPLTRSTQNAQINKLIYQIEILKRYEFEKTAELLVNWAVRDFRNVENRVKLYLCDLGGPNLKVTLATLLLIENRQLITQEHLKIAYPLAYSKTFQQFGLGIDPKLMLSIAKKESLLNSNAVSHANAKGLMQLNPKTAASLVQGVEVNLFDTKTNIILGARHLRDLLSQLDGKIYEAVAAYNAGIERVLNWKKRFPTSDPILFTDLIPYRETRDYVGYVLGNYYWYRRLYQEKKDLKSLLVIDRNR